MSIAFNTDLGRKPNIFVADGKTIVEGKDIPNLVWYPQAGSQEFFMRSEIFETLYEGTRGPGKTDALLMDFFQHTSKGSHEQRGYGAEWRGIIFRRTYPELEDIINKSMKWFPLLDPGAAYNRNEHKWTFSQGETLYFRHMADPKDYWKYHGHAYPWIGWEEITSWPDARCYLSMMTCSRSTVHGMPRKYRSTTNPYGVGHNWVKKRWRLHLPFRKVIDDSKLEDGRLEPERVAIRGDITENRILLDADPDYINRIAAGASSPQQLAAWLYGSWDIVSGGMFDDVWDNKIHVVEPFEIPQSWTITRSYDWGSSSPGSVGWYAESDGTDFLTRRGMQSSVVGDIYRIYEWYIAKEDRNESYTGLGLLASEIAQTIVQKELEWGIYYRVDGGVADGMIFNPTATGRGLSIAEEMEEPCWIGERRYATGEWDKADKSSGSRVAGWQAVRQRLKNSIPVKGGGRDKPGLFVFGEDRNPHFLRTFVTLPRDDEKPDDVNTEVEDHIGDEVRYRCYNPPVFARISHVSY